MQNMVQLLIPETVGITVFLVKKVTLTFLDDTSPECLRNRGTKRIHLFRSNGVEVRIGRIFTTASR